MATWKDLDSELGYDKDEAGNKANAGVGLVATVNSEAEPDTTYEDEKQNETKK